MKQPKDDAGNIVPLLSLKPGKAHQINFTFAASNTSPQITSKVVAITPSVDCFVELANTASNSTSHYLLASTVYDISMGGESFAQYISVIGKSANGILYISERD